MSKMTKNAALKNKIDGTYKRPLQIKKFTSNCLNDHLLHHFCRFHSTKSCDTIDFHTRVPLFHKGLSSSASHDRDSAAVHQSFALWEISEKNTENDERSRWSQSLMGFAAIQRYLRSRGCVLKTFFCNFWTFQLQRCWRAWNVTQFKFESEIYEISNNLAFCFSFCGQSLCHLQRKFV